MNKQQAQSKILAVVFGLAGLAWIIGGVFSISHFVLFPFIGVVNLGVAYGCLKLGN